MENRRVVALAVLAVIGAAAHITATRTQLATGNGPPQADGLKPQRLIEEQSGFPIDASPDGRTLVLVTQSFGRGTEENPSQLLIRDVASTVTRPLDPGSSFFGPGGRPEGVFSPDLRQVAYVWTESASETRIGVRTNLRVTSTAKAATPRTLAGQGHVPHGWSADGRSILILVHGAASSPISFAWLSAEDGAVNRIKTFEVSRSAADPRLSPDGARIAYTAFAPDGARDRYVYVMEANGQNERVVASLPGSNTRPVWAPDSAHLVFVNTQSSHRALYGVAVDGGRSVEPVRLLGDLRGDPIRISGSGALLYFQADDGILQMVANSRTGRARIVDAFVGMSGTWSRQGRLAFFRPGLQGLVTRSLDTGDERIYEHAVNGNSPANWLSDESGMIVYLSPAADGGRPGGAFYHVDLKTGKFTRLFARDTDTHVRSFIGVLSPDDKTFFLAARERTVDAPWTRIVGVDVATGAERVVATLPAEGLTTPPALALSPDGSTLAIRTETGRVMTIQIDGRAFREIGRPLPALANPYGRAAQASPAVMKWTPDGKSIVFAASAGLPGTGWRLMRISASSGQLEADSVDSSRLDSAVSIRRDVGAITSLDISGDGAHIAFSTRASPTYAIWRLADVVSQITRAR